MHLASSVYFPAGGFGGSQADNTSIDKIRIADAKIADFAFMGIC